MKRVNVLVSSLIIIISSFITIGYSSFSNNLYVDGMSINVRVLKDIRVTGISIMDSGDGGKSTYEEYDVASILMGINLENSNSYVTYKVDITNYGNIPMGIFKINGEDDGIRYEIINYQVGSKLCDVDNNCTSGSNKEIYIKISTDYEDYFNRTFSVRLDFDFRSFHSITYTGVNINLSSFPNEVIDGGEILVDFQDYGVVDLEIYSEDFLLNDYIFDEGILLLSNIESDITINLITYDEEILEREILIDSLLDYISLLETVEGALNEVHDMLNRMAELTVFAANNNLYDADFYAISMEMEQLTIELNRVCSETMFNDFFPITEDITLEIPLISNTLQFDLLKINLDVLNIPYIEYKNSNDAMERIDSINNAINIISNYRGYLGSKMNEYWMIAYYYDMTIEDLRLSNRIYITSLHMADSGLFIIEDNLYRMISLCDMIINNYGYGDVAQSLIEEIYCLKEAINVVVDESSLKGNNLLDGTYLGIDNVSTSTLGQYGELYLVFDSFENIELSRNDLEFAFNKIAAAREYIGSLIYDYEESL